jgi:hypothetical protein
MPRLVRDRDGEGHYGSRVESINPETGERTNVSAPVIGECFFIGTVTAGTFSQRDWWCTTPVTEIISEDDKKIRFKTGNSTYTYYK